MVDLPSYLRRIGHDGPVAPTLDTLRALHARHPAAIAFESLDPFLGRPVSIDPATVRTKLVGGARGGYCHEHNLLFHDVLAAIGFRVTALGARVAWMAQGRINPRTHRLTLVDLPRTDAEVIAAFDQDIMPRFMDLAEMLNDRPWSRNWTSCYGDFGNSPCTYYEHCHNGLPLAILPLTPKEDRYADLSTEA